MCVCVCVCVNVPVCPSALMVESRITENAEEAHVPLASAKRLQRGLVKASPDLFCYMRQVGTAQRRSEM